MTQEILRLGMNASDLIAEAGDVAKILKTLNTRFSDITNVVHTFNDAGDKIGVAFNGITEAGKKFSASFRDVEGTLKIARAGFNDTASSAKSMRQEVLRDAELIAQGVFQHFKTAKGLDDVFREQGAEVDAIFKRLESVIRSRLGNISDATKLVTHGAAGSTLVGAGLKSELLGPASTTGSLALSSADAPLREMQMAVRETATALEALKAKHEGITAAIVAENQAAQEQARIQTQINALAEKEVRIAGEAAAARASARIGIERRTAGNTPAASAIAAGEVTEKHVAALAKAKQAFIDFGNAGSTNLKALEAASANFSSGFFQNVTGGLSKAEKVLVELRLAAARAAGEAGAESTKMLEKVLAASKKASDAKVQADKDAQQKAAETYAKDLVAWGKLQDAKIAAAAAAAEEARLKLQGQLAAEVADARRQLDQLASERASHEKKLVSIKDQGVRDRIRKEIDAIKSKEAELRRIEQSKRSQAISQTGGLGAEDEAARAKQLEKSKAARLKAARELRIAVAAEAAKQEAARVAAMEAAVRKIRALAEQEAAERAKAAAAARAAADAVVAKARENREKEILEYRALISARLRMQEQLVARVRQFRDTEAGEEASNALKINNIKLNALRLYESQKYRELEKTGLLTKDFEAKLAASVAKEKIRQEQFLANQRIIVAKQAAQDAAKADIQAAKLAAAEKIRLNKLANIRTARAGAGEFFASGISSAIDAGARFTGDQNAAITKIKSQMLDLGSATEMPKERFDALFNSILQGYNVLAQNPAERQLKQQLTGLVASFNNVRQAAIDAAAAEQKHADKMALSARVGRMLNDVIKLPKGIQSVDTSRVNAAVIDAQKAASNLGISATRVVQIFKQMQAGIRPVLSETERDVVKSLRRVQTALDSARKNTKGFTDGFLLSWQSMGRLVAIQQLHRAVALVSNALREGIRTAVTFGQTVARIVTIVNEGDQSTQGWTDSIVSLSNAWGINLQDAAEGIFDAVSNQIVNTTNDIKLFGDATARLARVTGSSFEQTGNLLAGLINSFNLGLGSLDKVTGQVFRAVDKGKFTIEEIAEQIGRAAPTAELLGIKMEELFGGLASLTIQGRKANTSLTLLRNIMAKSLKPTEEMQAIIEELGFSTARAAISSLGFTEFLTKLAQFNPERLTKAFSDLRAVEGILALVGKSESFDRLRQNIEEIGKSSEDFAKKADEFFRDPFVRLAQEGERLKNFFQIEVGRPIVLAFAQLSDSVGGFTNAFREMGGQLANSPIVQLTGQLLGFATSITDARSAMHTTFTLLEAGFNALVVKWILGSNLMVSAFQKVNLAVLATTGSVVTASKYLPSVITGVVVGLTLFTEKVASGYRELDAATQRFADQLGRITESKNKRDLAEIAQQFEQITGGIEKAEAALWGLTEAQKRLKTFQRDSDQVIDFYTKLQNEAKRAKSALADANKEVTNLIKEQFDIGIKNAENSIRDVKQAMRGLLKEIEDSNKSIAKLFEDNAQEQMKLALALAQQNDDAAIGFLREERKRLEKVAEEIAKTIEDGEKRITDLVATGAKEKFDFAQSFRDAEQQMRRLYDQAEMFRSRAIVGGNANEFGKARESLSGVQEILRSQIEEAKQAAQAAQSSKAQGNTVAERIKDRERLREVAEAALKKERELTLRLVQIEEKRKSLLDEQIAAERNLIAAKKLEQDEALRKRDELLKAELNYQRQADTFAQGQIAKLEQTAREAVSAGNFDSATKAREMQSSLLDQLKTQRVSALADAKRAGDIETAKTIQAQLVALQKQEFALVDAQVALEQSHTEALRKQYEEKETSQKGEIARLLEARNIVRDIGKLSLLNKDGTIKDLQAVEAELLRLADNFKNLVGSGGFVDSEGRDLDLNAVISGALSNFKKVFQEAQMEGAVPFKEELNALGIDTKDLDTAFINLQNHVGGLKDAMKKLQDQTGAVKVQFNEATKSALVAGRQLGDELIKQLDPNTSNGLLGLFQNLDITGASKLFIGKFKDIGSDLFNQFLKIQDSLGSEFAKAQTGGVMDPKAVAQARTELEALKQTALDFEANTAGTDRGALTEKLGAAIKTINDQIKAAENLSKLAGARGALDAELSRIQDLFKAVESRRESELKALKLINDQNAALTAQLTLAEKIRNAALGNGAEAFDARRVPFGAGAGVQNNGPVTYHNEYKIEINSQGIFDPKAAARELIDEVNRQNAQGINRIR